VEGGARRVAHEIKNPLTPISLSAEQIRGTSTAWRDLAKAHSSSRPRSPSFAAPARSSRRRSRACGSLVDQFAALAAVPHRAAAARRPQHHRRELARALRRPPAEHPAGASDLAPNLPLVLADPEAMKRALGNLIDNAAEAMQQSLLRELRVSTALLPSGMVELTVADTGSGLTDEMRERLFLPYFSTKQRGTGLGLAIAAKIIQEHGGTIRAEKNEPAGAKFIVELRPAPANRRRATGDAPGPINCRTRPCSEPAPSTQRELPRKRYKAARMNHVLIVDDEAEIRDSLESILAKRATSSPPRRPRRGARPCSRRIYDVVLLDIWLPDRDGLDALGRHSPDGLRAHMPEVIIISGHGTIEAAVRATKLGAYDFLEKPLSLDRTLIVLKNAINARQLREDNQEFVRQLSFRAASPATACP
jgi:FixJ family two-component response regulator